MIIKTSDDKIKSIYEEITTKYLNLRPDFQRGEVWSATRKKLLIDTILRGWQIPPVHTIKVDSNLCEVLDGQQRLTAIRDFIENKFRIDGNIEPEDDEILELDRKYYKDLPRDKKSAFDNYTIKIFEIQEYNPGEPGELFHRLNQSVKLTSSEQRNAFFGNIRDQISNLVTEMKSTGVDKEILGFSNSRMAYNDLLTRICFLMENDGLRTVITDKALTDRYRSEEKFSEEIISSVKKTIIFFSEIKKALVNENTDISLTKASSLSWMYFLSNESLLGNDINHRDYYTPFLNLEFARNAIKNNVNISHNVIEAFSLDKSVLRELILIYIERSSARVMSIGSILIRDIIIHLAVHNMVNLKDSLSVDDNNSLKKLAFKLRQPNVDVKQILENLSEQWKASEYA
jgi:hypothetical protein